ncbi:tetratricopeptide repeat protein [Algoriphagus jejuensis]|uniref:Tetratricopeptide repeat protein n=1 Tax=Algoriphagus jejuensis TaxID=419934 RepID=A0ABP3YAP1_9BACT
MNAAQFLDLIQKTDHLERDDLLQLTKIQENFPYFQIPHVLAARHDFLKNGRIKSNILAQAAITSPDRIWLKTLVESPATQDFQPTETQKDLLPESPEIKNSENQTEAPNNLDEQQNGTAAKPEGIDTDKSKLRRRQPPKDDLLETIKRKEKKAILDAKKKEQIDLIKAFSKKDIKLATIKEIEANQNTENLAEASTKLNENLLSETFARILINQGKKVKAKEIYEKLILKFPEKRAYFADLIEKLKE